MGLAINSLIFSGAYVPKDGSGSDFPVRRSHNNPYYVGLSEEMFS